MVRFTLWLIATTAFLKISSAQLEISECPECNSSQVCVLLPTGHTCAVKNGLPCTFDDYCEGNYYCPSSKVCAGGPDGIAEGEKCDGTGCKPGLYCDPSQKKCLKLQSSSECTGDFDCNKFCSSSRGCYCDKGQCFFNP